MSDIKNWSNSAGGNTSLSPNGFPEGMAPSGVNDAAREVMASVRRERESAEWFDWGYTPTYATTSTFTLVGDRTSIFHVGRRVRCGDASTLYGTITDTTYSSATRVSVSFPSGQLSASLSSVAVGILSFSAHSIPIGIFAELSATNTFTAPVSFSATVSFTSRTVFNNGVDVSATANLIGRVLVGGGLASSATASFTSRAVFNAGIDVSDTASFAGRVLANGSFAVSGTASFASSVAIAGAVALAAGLAVSATASFTSRVVMNDGLDISGTASFKNGLLGSWVSRSDNTVYTATSDTTVMVYLSCADTNRGSSAGYTDGSNPPTTIRGRESIQFASANAIFNQYGSYQMPVRKGDYWKVVKTEDAGTITQTVFSIRMKG